jgi:sugar O-acyltransferase (sialic acid O-acetyltransferase NeuD family)
MRLVLFGAADIARLARFYFEHDSPHQVVAFAVDSAYRSADSFDGLPLIDFESVSRTYPPEGFGLFVAVSYARMNELRAERVRDARGLGYATPSYISSRCTYLAPPPRGGNHFILEDNSVQPFVEIGDNVTFWSGNHIGHDSVIEDNVFISSHCVVSGHVTVGAASFLGVNCTIGHQVRVAAKTLVGAGAIITKDTQPGAVHVPARSIVLDRRSDEISL